MTVLEQTKVINGNFGKLYHEGVHLNNVTNIEATVDINYEEIKRSGTRHTGHKAMDIVMTGTIGAYTVSYEFIKRIGQITDDSQGAFVTELHFRLEDPENSETGEFVRLKGVQFQNIPLANTEVGSVVEHELQFTFDGYEYM